MEHGGGQVANRVGRPVPHLALSYSSLECLDVAKVAKDWAKEVPRGTARSSATRSKESPRFVL